jgi:hypothetical protein
MADSQKMAKNESSGGMRINDHRFFGGAGSPAFPKGVHTKNESTAEGAGEVMKYEDTTEAIKSVQEAGEKHIKGRPLKPGYRN